MIKIGKKKTLGDTEVGEIVYCNNMIAIVSTKTHLGNGKMGNVTLDDAQNFPPEVECNELVLK